MKINLKSNFLNLDGMPSTLVFSDQPAIEDFAEWYIHNKDVIHSKLLKEGAILLKGLNVNSSGKLQSLMQKIYPDAPRYLDGNSSRGKHLDNVYNASEYDSDSVIQLHTEFSYSNIWPAIICFCCENKADSGGQTTIGDARQVIKLLDTEIVNEFSRKGITYIRNMQSISGLGPSWKEAFESDDKLFVENYCKSNSIEFKWNKDNSLKLTQTRPAIRKHPVTNEDLWFNQVDQFFPQIYGEEVFTTLLSISGDNVENMPMYSRYGDGSEIQMESIEKIIDVLNKITIPVNWEVGDFLWVDNMLSLHGRLPFKGPRKILVSMA